MDRSFTVEGMPCGKGRPRFTRAGHTYTPKKTADYEKLIRFSYQAQVKEDPVPEDTPVSISILAVFPMSKGDNKATREAKLDGRVLPTKKPDCDNIAKVVCDALNGVAYADDKQIVACSVKKVYGQFPMIKVKIAI